MSEPESLAGDRVCLVGATHPCHNPRLVREADSLAEAGFSVRVVTPSIAIRLADKDERLMSRRKWRLDSVDYRPTGITPRARGWWFRGRRRLAQECFRQMGTQAAAELSALAALPELSRVAGREPADWFVAHTQPALPAAARAARRWNARLGFDCEDLLTDTGAQDAGAMRRIETEYLPLCSYVSAPSKEIARILSERYQIPLPMVLYNVFPCSLAEGMMPPLARPGRSVLRLHWFSQVIGPGRGIEDAVRAVGLLGSDVELHLRGTRLEGYVRQLEGLARDCGASGRIFFHPQIDHDDLIRSMEQFDIGLALEGAQSGHYSPTVTNKVFSYLLAGLPVGATDTAGQREALDSHQEVRFFYPAGKPEALAAGLRVWKEDREALRSAQQSAWETARRELCWDKEQRKFLDLIGADRGTLVPVPQSVRTA